MKQLFAITLALVLVFGLTACGGKSKTPTTTPTTTATTVPMTTAPVTTQPMTDPTVATNIPDPSVDTSIPEMTDLLPTEDVTTTEVEGTTGTK